MVSTRRKAATTGPQAAEPEPQLQPAAVAPRRGLRTTSDAQPQVRFCSVKCHIYFITKAFFLNLGMSIFLPRRILKKALPLHWLQSHLPLLPLEQLQFHLRLPPATMIESG